MQVAAEVIVRVPTRRTRRASAHLRHHGATGHLRTHGSDRLFADVFRQSSGRADAEIAQVFQIHRLSASIIGYILGLDKSGLKSVRVSP